MNGNLNLSELEKELDEVLSKETSETLSNWLLTKRKTNNMEKIFVPLEIAIKLKEIGFDKPCMAVYSKGKMNLINPDDEIKLVLFEDEVFIPVWEQVFTWFREKGYYFQIQCIYPHNVKYWWSLGTSTMSVIAVSKKNYKTYEECREALVLNLIEFFENENTKDDTYRG